jgi:hypothetical protein
MGHMNNSRDKGSSIECLLPAKFKAANTSPGAENISRQAPLTFYFPQLRGDFDNLVLFHL